ncbi:uncharacterized protein LOC62_04G005258 [Vanrija pseudolonga]|uniref:Uncharacterized protein n=1 Tax=Vanrija pseudolonga TaxID=143232 RepID=A0AAF0Y9B2_9TREE|nr:hypothetical protein LOC62_04G005258 [Vanrija pseudolonga]
MILPADSDDGEEDEGEAPYRFKGRDLPAHESFAALQGGGFGDDLDPGRKWFFDDEHVAWLTMPTHWGDTNSYMVYGSEWWPGWSYVNVALVAKIPSAEERAIGVER